MSEETSTASAGPSLHPGGAPAAGVAGRGRAAVPGRARAWIPGWNLITTKHLELRKRRGLLIVVALLTVGLPVVVLGLRLAFHLFDPKSYGPAGTPATLQSLCNTMAEFGFIVAATLGATAGTSDLTDGMFRHLVITGRSRLALYLARIPAGLAIVLPLVAIAFTMVCLVTSYEGVAQPASISVNGATVPAHLDEAQLQTWLLRHPGEVDEAIGPVTGPGPVSGSAGSRATLDHNIATIYASYTDNENDQLDQPVNEMVKIGLWIELEVGIGFLVGLGLGSLTGQRTVTTVLMIVLEIIITPILARTAIPHFLDGQRLIVGVAMDQLRPAGLGAGLGGPGPGGALFGGRGVLSIPPMPTWAMISVIVGWIVGWSAIGAWRMATRDA